MKTAGTVLGVIFWGVCREGGLQPQLITGEFNGILNPGATPSNYLRTKGVEGWTRGSGRAGWEGGALGRGGSYNPSDFRRNLRHSLKL